MLTPIRHTGKRIFSLVESWSNAVFTPAWNPFYQLGALTIFFFWIVLVSGLYLFVFFDTSVFGAYASVERLTNEQWYLGGVMRSLHRYASDAAVVTMLFHVFREFVNDRYRGFNWFSWFTGVPLTWMVVMLGITGYWLVWDTLAQYVAIGSSELLDWLPIFTDPMARNFLTAESLSDRFFTLMAFLHLIGIPIFLVFGIWFHLLRIARPKVNPPRGLMAGTFLALMVLSFVKPAVSHGPADLSMAPTTLQLDWFYLNIYPLVDRWPTGAVWALLWGATVLLMLMPWLPWKRREPVAVVELEHCNGCGRCFVDCPYGAVAMQPRTDGRPYKEEAVVDPDLCASCGICVGACPSSTPFRSVAELVTGIDLPHIPIQDVRGSINTELGKLTDSIKVIVFGCDHAANVKALQSTGVATLSLPCTGMFSPTFIDYVFSRKGVDGVVVTGCQSGGCYFRLGNRWMEERIHGEREPHLRNRVDRERVKIFWAMPTDAAALARELEAFRTELRDKKQADEDMGSDAPAITRRQERAANG